MRFIEGEYISIDQAALMGKSLPVSKKVGDEGKSSSFLGILSMLDPPRDDSKQTIDSAKEHGLRVKMVTGDDVAIGSQISGQPGMGTHLITAVDMFTKEVDMSHLPQQITENVDRADGFGRVFPEHKYGIVHALQVPIYWVYASAWQLQYVPAEQIIDVLSLFGLQFVQPLRWFR